ncbi:MAG TPA: hypothetical protein VF282_10030 [Bacillota bacterium]
MPQPAAGLERALEGLVGVLAARVRMGADAAVEEVEVLAEGTKAPVQVAHDVKSLLFTRFGLSVDPERITVAKLAAADEMGLREVRLRIARLVVRHHDGQVEVEVGLREGSRLSTGRAAAPRARATVPWLVARATLDAAQAALCLGDRWRVEDVARVELAGVPAIVVAVRNAGGGRETLLLGASAIGKDELEAGARAVLDAINRRFVTDGR